MSLSRKSVVVGVIALLALQWVWHVLLMPPERGNVWVILLLFCLPILPSVALFLCRRPSASFWAGVAALLYFSHGITEAWTLPQARPVAIGQAFLAVWIIVAGSWPGLQARRKKVVKPPAIV